MFRVFTLTDRVSGPELLVAEDGLRMDVVVGEERERVEWVDRIRGEVEKIQEVVQRLILGHKNSVKGPSPAQPMVTV